ncbi:MAG: hypothetical protein AAGL90_12425 [Pseudomonadota bacterium]
MIRRSLAIGVAAFCLSNCSPSDPNQIDSETGSDPRSWDQVLSESGLAAAEARLETSEASAATAFRLGGVRFLRAVEHILQVRYANYSGALPLIPGMRNELPANPESRFDPAFLENAVSGALEHLANAESALGPAIDGSFEADVPFDAIWFDINDNGVREEWESLEALMTSLGTAPDESFGGLIRFDTADAEWLAAYVHVLSAASELVLSLDPTPAVRRVYEGRSQLAELGAPSSIGFLNDEFLDIAAATLLTLRGQPDRTRTRAAHAHFKAMIEHNKAFWTEVNQETDDTLEWLPNPSQTSAFGLTIPAEMAESWQDVLTEIDAILEGEKLVPFFRMGVAQAEDENGQGIGLNLKKLLQEPGDMDPIMWIQGAAAMPYLETGALADAQAWAQFEQLTRGNGLVFAMLLN